VSNKAHQALVLALSLRLHKISEDHRHIIPLEIRHMVFHLRLSVGTKPGVLYSSFLVLTTGMRISDQEFRLRSVNMYVDHSTDNNVCTFPPPFST
jgi:hypothetical protein